MYTTEKATETLAGLVRELEGAGKITEAVNKVIIECPDVPARDWSWGNQLITGIFGGWDSRGFRQWKKAGRRVKKGAKALYILVPLIKDEVDADGEKSSHLYGFKSCPVFRAQDTLTAEGEDIPIEYEYTNRPDSLPDLARVGKGLGCSVEYTGSRHGEAGSYCPGLNEIRLCTPDETTLFHEIAHKIDDVMTGLEQKDRERQECVAQLSAECIARLYGRKTDTKYTVKYIQGWSGKEGKDLGLYLYGILGRVAKIVAEFVRVEDNTSEKGVKVAE